MRNSCYYECSVRTNSWDETEHGHGYFYINDLERMPSTFKVEDGILKPMYYGKLIEDDKLTKIIADWYPKVARPFKSISEFNIRFWTGDRKLLFYIKYADYLDWKPVIVYPLEPPFKLEEIK